MASSEYQELADFFVDRLERVQAETRTFVQVSVESLRDEIRVVADGVLMNRERIEANTRSIDANTRSIEANGARIDALSRRVDGLTEKVGGLEQTMSTGFAGHEARLRALERP